MARALEADIYTGFIDKSKTFDTKGVNIHSLNIRGPQLYRNIKIAKKFDSFEFPKKYDAYIFSGTWCISAAKNCHPNILYLHTPMRVLYDLRRYFIQRTHPAGRFLLRKFINYWIPKDQTYMRHFDLICANSENVKKRVLKYYGNNIHKNTVVVYTGIETRKYKYIKKGNFYLSAARLDPLKRIDMLIQAFKKMPDKKLIIAGSGPDEKRLKALARNCKNIELLGSVNDKQLLHLYGTCKATIAANMDEDLGLIAIESHASGKPIIAIKEGGFLETVNNTNGVFFSNHQDIPRAIERLEKTEWNHRLIQRSAQKFDIDEFSSNVKSILNAVIKKYNKK